MSAFHRLATVELQLIFHYCDQHSWLSLARCSHFTLSAVSEEFASKHTQLAFAFQHPWPMPHALPQPGLFGLMCCWFANPVPPPSLGILLRRSLLRHCPVSLSITQFEEQPLSAANGAIMME